MDYIIDNQNITPPHFVHIGGVSDRLREGFQGWLVRSKGRCPLIVDIAVTS